MPRACKTRSVRSVRSVRPVEATQSEMEFGWSTLGAGRYVLAHARGSSCTTHGKPERNSKGQRPANDSGSAVQPNAVERTNALGGPRRLARRPGWEGSCKVGAKGGRHGAPVGVALCGGILEPDRRQATGDRGGEEGGVRGSCCLFQR